MNDKEVMLGDRMYAYEIDQCLKGLREPLPITPILSKVKSNKDVEDNINKLVSIYGTITKELLDKCLKKRIDDRLIDKYWKVWTKMNTCVSCGGPSKYDFCEFCLNEE